MEYSVKEIKKYWFYLAILIYVMYINVMHKWGLQGDMEFWKNWTHAIYTNGFTNIYNSNVNCNYLPLYLYFLAFHVKFQNNITDIQDNLYTLKFYTLIFDMLGAFAAVWFVKDTLKKVVYFLLLIFNIAYIYNTVYWGQVDAIFSFFGFVSIIAAIEKRVIISIFFLFIALNFKLQALVFIPITGLILLPQIVTKDGIKKAFLALIIISILQFLILLPFILKEKLNEVYHVITGSVGFYPYPTVGAFNVWSILLPSTSQPHDVPLTDDVKFYFLTYKQIGFMMFVTSYFLSVFPLLYVYYQKYKNGITVSFDRNKLFVIAALLALNFFYFNTQMHERYAHPALLPLAAYAFCSRNFFPIILGSLAYFLNLDKICWYLNIRFENYSNWFFFQPLFVSVLYGILIAYLFYRLYQKNTNNLESEMINL